MKAINKEYNAVCSLIRRSGLQDINRLPFYINARSLHSSTSNYQKVPPDPNKDKKGKDDEDDNKMSSLLAKAFLWMLTAYMVIAIISLLFPSTNQPEVGQKFFSHVWANKICRSYRSHISAGK